MDCPLYEKNWGSAKIVTRNTLYDATELPGFIAEQNKKPAGLILYNIKNNQCEIVLLESFVEKIGIGSTKEGFFRGCRPPECH